MNPFAGSCFRFVVWLALLAGGCGSMNQSAEVKDERKIADLVSGKRVPVHVGKVGIREGVEVEDAQKLNRYLTDVLKEALEAHGGFVVLDAEQEGLLKEYQLKADPVDEPEPAAYVDVLVLGVREKKGATVSLGFASSQKKYAEVEVALVYRTDDPQERVTLRNKARSHKKAWGVVAKVRRDSMDEGDGTWKVDTSMTGVASHRAISKGVHLLYREL